MEPATITSAVAALMGVVLGIERVVAYRVATNGGKPITEKSAKEMEDRLKSAIDGHANTVEKHIKQNHEEHGDLHSRITEVAEDVAEMRGKLSAGA